MHEFRTRRRIEFSDTDMGGIVHFARFFVFMETAEHELLHAIGATPHGTVEGRQLGWPRVAASCDYLAPARYGDVLDITVRVARKGEKSMTYAIEFHCDGDVVARGRVTSVCCDIDDGPFRAVPIPASIADKIEEAPGEKPCT